MKPLRQLTLDDFIVCEQTMTDAILGGFDEGIQKTVEWLRTPEAKRFYSEQRQQLNSFFRESGIDREWQEIIDNRARHGVDITKQIFDYARDKNLDGKLVPYTAQETRAFNRLADYNYELIRNVTNDEITAIRRQLIQDYAEGRHPTKTTLKELQLEPINGWSPEERAVVISRTESARTLNTSMLETYHSAGIELVVLYGDDDTCCDDCREYMKEPVTVEEAMNIGVMHPNCRCAWIPYTEKDEDENNSGENDEPEPITE